MKLHVVLRERYRAISAIAIIITLLLTASCHKENQSVQYPIPSNLKMISAGYASGAATKVVIYATEDLYVGYNKLYLALYDSTSNVRITQAQVSLSTFTGTNLSGPVENPATSAADNGLFNAAMVYVSAGSWTLSARIQNTANSKSGNFTAAVSPVQTSPARSYSVTTADSANLFVSIVQPTAPQLGVNTFELVVDKQINALSYAPDSTYMVDINATMPFMTGMSSPNNVNPAYIGNGHYTGRVDFIMSGGWRIYVDLLRNGAVSDTTHYFDLNL